MATTRAHAVSDVGVTRTTNQDSAYAGTRLFLVADGMGGHAGGDVASALAIRHLATLDREYASAQEADAALREGFATAAQELADTVAEHGELAGMGTTVSGFALVDRSIALAHIGDSRIYRYRAGALTQVTADHTFVQRLVETGRITAEEAAHHPKRSVLMRVLGDVDIAPEVDTAIIPTESGDRWLLCSDGLSSYVPDAGIAEILDQGLPTESTVAALLQASLDAGAPDNVTIVVLDVGDEAAAVNERLTVGAAARPLQFTPPPVRRQPRIPTMLLHPLRTTTTEDTHFEPEADEYLALIIAEDRRRLRRRRITGSVIAVLAIAIVAIGLFLGYRYTQSQYFVGEEAGRVAIFQGVQAELGPISLSHLVRVTDIEVADLPQWRQQAVLATIPAASIERADEILKELDRAANG